MKSRTIYQLRERINQGLHLMYSSSMGSIQAALKKLLNKGYIRYEEIVENGKYKKVYMITDSGKQHFFTWVNRPMDDQCARNPELAKVYFMGFSDKSHRQASIEQHLVFLKEQHAALDAICREAVHMETDKANAEICRYQLASARYGRDFMKFNIDWYEQLLYEMEKEEE